jgi:molecular chaperone DnaJ
MAQKACYYEVLGVTRDASGDEVATAYRRLAIQYHPDKNPGDEEAIAKFKEAAEAFEVLHDGEKRSLYDRYGHAGVSGGASSQFSDVEDVFSAFGDIFGDLFGGGRRSRRGRRSSRGADVQCEVELTLAEAAQGVSKTVHIKRHESCADCGGSGARPGTTKTTCEYCGGHGQIVQSSGIFRVQTTCPSCRGVGTRIDDPCRVCRGSGLMPKQVETEVRIPAGVDTGMQIRIAEQGEPSRNGGPAGDCFCHISVQEHPLFERDGRNLICRVPITYPQAALGATIEVPTLDGRQDHNVPRGTQSGQVFRLRGLGMRDPRRQGVGDLLVQVFIEVPEDLSDREEELLRDLAEEEHSNVAPQRKSFFETLKSYFVGDDEDTEE